MITFLRLGDLDLVIEHELEHGKTIFNVKGGDHYIPPHQRITLIRLDGTAFDLRSLFEFLGVMDIIEAELTSHLLKLAKGTSNERTDDSNSNSSEGN